MGIALHDPLQFYAGDTWEIEFDCHEPDGSVTDLSGATIEWKLDVFDPVTNVLTRGVGAGITVKTPATGGICVLLLNPADTAVLTPGFYRDQLRVTTPGGVVSTQAAGRIEVLQPI